MNECYLPNPAPPICPYCGATVDDGCMIDNPNEILMDVALEHKQMSVALLQISNLGHYELDEGPYIARNNLPRRK